MYTLELVGNETEPFKSTATPFEIRCFRSKDLNDLTRHKTLSLSHFSQAAIKDILLQHVQGFNPGRTIAYLPKNTERNDYELISTADLYYELHDASEADCDAALEEKATRIKSSSAIVMIHEYTVKPTSTS